MSEVSKVLFHGRELLTVKNGETIRVALKPIVEALGLDWSAQYRRALRHPVLAEGIAMTATPSRGGAQEAVTLPLDMLNGWLFGVEANRVKPELRETILAYQRECYRVLFEHWHGRKARPAIPRPSTTRDRETLYHLVASIVVAHRIAFDKAYTLLNGYAGVAHFRDMTTAHIEDATGFAERLLEGSDTRLDWQRVAMHRLTHEPGASQQALGLTFPDQPDLPDGLTVHPIH